MRVAAIDCGTNSIRLLIADVQADGSLVEVIREMDIVRLGQGVDKTGAFHPDAITRTLRATTRYAGLIAEHKVERLRFVATSATRDAQNRAEFIEGVRTILGVVPEVISGAEEAELSFLGASLGVDAGVTPVLVIDIGGGSTEFVLGGTEVIAARSLDIGSVRLTERHQLSDPPTQRQLDAVRQGVQQSLQELEGVVDLEKARALVGVAGTVTSVTAAALGLPAYERERVHGAVIPFSDVTSWCQKLATGTWEQRKEIPSLHPGRVEVIGAGAVILEQIVAKLASLTNGAVDALLTSESDILDGIAARLGGIGQN